MSTRATEIEWAFAKDLATVAVGLVLLEAAVLMTIGLRPWGILPAVPVYALAVWILTRFARATRGALADRS